MPDDQLPRPETHPGAHPEPRPASAAGPGARSAAEAERLGEMLDLLATVMASLSDRVDTQTQTLDRLTRTAAETRQAAFQARSQAEAMPVLAEMAEALADLTDAVREPALARIEAAIAGHRATAQEAERLRRLTAQRSRRRAWLYASVPVLAFGLLLAGAVLGPRAVTALDWRAGCALIGGEPVGGMLCDPEGRRRLHASYPQPSLC